MTGSNASEIRFDASAWRVAIVAARFNFTLVDQLVEIAADAGYQRLAGPGPSVDRVYARSGEVSVNDATATIFQQDDDGRAEENREPAAESART